VSRRGCGAAGCGRCAIRTSSSRSWSRPDAPGCQCARRASIGPGLPAGGLSDRAFDAVPHGFVIGIQCLGYQYQLLEQMFHAGAADGQAARC